MLEKSQTFKIENITILDKYKKDLPLIKNFSFNGYANETYAFLFTNEESKKSLIDLFSNNINKYNGYFVYDHKVFSEKNDNSKLKEIISLNDFDTLLKESHDIKLIDYFTKLFKENHIINIDFSNVLIEKVINEIVKRKIDSINLINLELTKILNIIQKSIYEIKLNHSIKNVESIFENLTEKYIDHLKSKIIILHKRNLESVHLITSPNDYVENKKIKNDDLKILELKSKISTYNNVFDINKERAKLNAKYFKYTKESKKILNIARKNLSFDYKIQKKNRKWQKNERYINSISKWFFWLFNNNKINKLSYLKNDQIKELFDEIKIIYYISLNSIEQNKEIENLNKFFAITKKQAITDARTVIKNFSKLAKQNIDLINNKIEKELEIEKEKFDNQKITTQEFKIYQNELQNLIDEKNWITKIEAENTQQKIETINKNAKEIFDHYNELNEKVISSLNELFTNSKSLNLENSEKFKSLENDFINKIDYYKNIYNSLKKDNSDINSFVLNLKKEPKLKAKTLFYKYSIYHYGNIVDISFFDLQKNIKKTTELLKSQYLLLKSLIEKKPVVLMIDLFKNLNDIEIRKIKDIYSKIIKNSNIIWIMIDDKNQDIVEISDWIYVFKNMNLIEWGKTSEIVENPFYETTKRLLNQETNKKDIDFENEKDLKIFDLFKNYDNYKLKDNHYGFGILEVFYKKMHSVPKVCEWTNNPIKIEDFINIIQFKKISKEWDKTHKLNIDNVDEKDNEKETIIVDVTKRINEMKKN